MAASTEARLGLISRLQFERIATVLGIAVILLPAAGFWSRWIAFRFGLDVDNAGALAFSAPIGALAFGGFTGLFASAGWFAALTLGLYRQLRQATLARMRAEIDRIVSRKEAADADNARVLKEFDDLAGRAARGEADAGVVAKDLATLEQRGLDSVKRMEEVGAALDALQQSEEWALLTAGRPAKPRTSRVQRWPRFPRAIWPAVGLTIGIGWFVFFPDWPYQLVGLLTAAVAIYVPTFVRPRFFPAFPALGIVLTVAVVMLLAAIGAGLSGNIGGEFAANYAFKPDARLTDGFATQLGDDGTFVFLQTCRSAQVLTVAKADIAHETSTTYRSVPFGPSLFDVIVHHKSPVVGYRPEC